MRIAICDGDAAAASKYRDAVARLARKHNIDADIICYSNPQKLLFDTDVGSLDILFSEVELSQLDGMELAKAIRSREISSEIIFLTRLKARVFEAFDVDALNYMIKNEISDAKFESVFLKAVNRAEKKPKKLISFNCAGEIRNIDVASLEYFESNDHVINVYYGNGQKFEFYTTMSKLENKLLDLGFVRIHRSFIISLDKVASWQRTELIMKNGNHLPVSRKGMEILRAYFEN